MVVEIELCPQKESKRFQFEVLKVDQDAINYVTGQLEHIHGYRVIVNELSKPGHDRTFEDVAPYLERMTEDDQLIVKYLEYLNSVKLHYLTYQEEKEVIYSNHSDVANLLSVCGRLGVTFYTAAWADKEKYEKLIPAIFRKREEHILEYTSMPEGCTLEPLSRLNGICVREQGKAKYLKRHKEVADILRELQTRIRFAA